MLPPVPARRRHESRRVSRHEFAPLWNNAGRQRSTVAAELNPNRSPDRLANERTLVLDLITVLTVLFGLALALYLI